MKFNYFHNNVQSNQDITSFEVIVYNYLDTVNNKSTLIIFSNYKQNNKMKLLFLIITFQCLLLTY